VGAVAETAGDHAVHEISEQENCHGQFKPLQHVTLRTDPLGLLDPRLPSSPGETTVTTTLMISIGLFALTGAAMGYAGLRRRGVTYRPGRVRSAATDSTNPARSSAVSTSSIVSGGLTRESTICWRHAQTILSSSSIWSSTKSSGDLASMCHTASRSPGKSLGWT
jgi:hypothetical protein